MERRVAAPLVVIIAAILVIGVRVLGQYQYVEEWQTALIWLLAGTIFGWAIFRPTPVGGKGAGMIILGVIILLIGAGV